MAERYPFSAPEIFLRSRIAGGARDAAPLPTYSDAGLEAGDARSIPAPAENEHGPVNHLGYGGDGGGNIGEGRSIEDSRNAALFVGHADDADISQGRLGATGGVIERSCRYS